MKKWLCGAAAVLLILCLTACSSDTPAASAAPINDSAPVSDAESGGCYLMAAEAPEEIRKEAIDIWEDWVTSSGADAGKYTLGTPFNTHPLDPDGEPFDCYQFPVLRSGVFWRILSLYEIDGEPHRQLSPGLVQTFENLRTLSSPEEPIRFVWVGDVRYAVAGSTAEILTHEGGDIPDNIGALAVQSDEPDSVVIDITKPIAAFEIDA